MTDENKKENITDNPVDTVTKNEDNQDLNSVPLKTLLEQKKANKELKEKIASFEAKEKELADAKLLEEKNYQELIQKKESELNNFKIELENEKKNNKLEKIKNKFSNELSKLNVIDSEDALRLVEYKDLLDQDSFDEEIKQRVTDLQKNKAYLFKSVTRNNNENGQPNQASPTQNKGNGKVDPLIQSLAAKFSIT